MHLFEENIKNLGLNIPELPKALANYVPYKIIGKTMYVSGQAPAQNGEQYIVSRRVLFLVTLQANTPDERT